MMRGEGGSSSNKTTAFPLVVPLLVGDTALGQTNEKEKGRRNCYYGFLSVLGRDYRLCVEEPEEESAEGTIGHQHGTLSNAQVSCEPALRLLLSPHLSVIKERLKQSADVETFLVELKDILERVVREETNEERAVDPSFYGRVVAELDAIGWHHLLWVDDTMTCLKLQQSDEEGRTHIVTLRLSSDHPQSAPLCMTDLPQPLVLRWHHKTSNLSHVLVQFKQALENYQPLWRVMDDFDDNTWVLEPDPGHASYSSTMRRIVTGNHCSLQLNLDPSHPFAVPECRLLGPDAIVGPLQQKLNSNLHHWDEAKLPRQNLEQILELHFPSPQTSTRQEFSMECGICYSYKQQTTKTETPDIVCNNARCGKPFHQYCLYEWLQSIPSTHRSFDTLFGACPYCSTQITVKQR